MDINLEPKVEESKVVEKDEQENSKSVNVGATIALLQSKLNSI